MSFHLDEYLQVVQGLPGLSRVGQRQTESVEWQSQLGQCLQAGAPGQLPLSEQVFPGDQVAIVISAHVPAGKEIAEIIIAKLMASGVEQNRIHVVSLNPLDESEGDREALWQVHHPAERTDSAMVGVSRRGQPIYMNATIANADVVIPVVPAGQGNSIDGYLYPAFSIQETRQRLGEDLPLAIEEALEAEQLISPFYVVGIVSAPGNQVGEVIVDSRENADEFGRQRHEKYWTAPQQSFDAILVTLGSVGRAVGVQQLHEAVCNASLMVESGAPIVLLGEVQVESSADWETEEERTIDDEDEASDVSASDSDDDDDEQADYDEDQAEYDDALELGDAMRESGWDVDEQIAQLPEGSVEEGTEETEEVTDEWSGEVEDDWESTIGPAEWRLRLSNLLEDLRARQPVFLLSNLEPEQVETLGFGVMEKQQELKQLLSSIQNIGLMEEGNRWTVVQQPISPA